MWVHLTNRIALGCLFLALSNTVLAEEAVDFDAAIARTLESNPGLVSFGYQVEAQQGLIRYSGMRPGVELGIDLENAVGTGAYSGVDAAEATISLAWSLERGKRQRRVDAAQASLSLLEADAELKRLDVAA